MPSHKRIVEILYSGRNKYLRSTEGGTEDVSKTDGIVSFVLKDKVAVKFFNFFMNAEMALVNDE